MPDYRTTSGDMSGTSGLGFGFGVGVETTHGSPPPNPKRMIFCGCTQHGNHDRCFGEHSAGTDCGKNVEGELVQGAVVDSSGIHHPMPDKVDKENYRQTISDIMVLLDHSKSSMTKITLPIEMFKGFMLHTLYMHSWVTSHCICDGDPIECDHIAHIGELEAVLDMVGFMIDRLTVVVDEVDEPANEYKSVMRSEFYDVIKKLTVEKRTSAASR